MALIVGILETTLAPIWLAPSACHDHTATRGAAARRHPATIKPTPTPARDEADNDRPSLPQTQEVKNEPDNDIDT